MHFFIRMISEIPFLLMQYKKDVITQLISEPCFSARLYKKDVITRMISHNSSCAQGVILLSPHAIQEGYDY